MQVGFPQAVIQLFLADRRPAPTRTPATVDQQDTPERGETAGDREYRVRWVVRGYWRNQWYPSRQEHRPVWINPHIKGPEGSPLHIGETVHVLGSVEEPLPGSD
jgi:hypothetical protein